MLPIHFQENQRSNNFLPHYPVRQEIAALQSEWDFSFEVSYSAESQRGGSVVDFLSKVTSFPNEYINK